MSNADGSFVHSSSLNKRGGEIIVAASDSLYKQYADYVCDGTDDHVEIQAAIDVAETAGGGAVHLSPGLFNIDFNEILISASNISLSGSGPATVVKLQAQAVAANHMLIKALGAATDNRISNIHVGNLTVDGNYDNTTGDHSCSMDAINFKWVDKGSVLNCFVNKAISEAIDIDYSNDIIIMGNTLNFAGGWGVHLSLGATDCIVVGNVAISCGLEGVVLGENRGGFNAHASSSRNVFVGNSARDCYVNYDIDDDEVIAYGNYSGGSPTIVDLLGGTTSLPVLYPANSQNLWRWIHDGLTGDPNGDLTLQRNYGGSWRDNVFNLARSTGHIGIGGEAAVSTQLDLMLNNGCLGLPSLTTTEIGNLTPKNGHLVYNETTHKLQIYADSAWCSVDVTAI